MDYYDLDTAIPQPQELDLFAEELPKKEQTVGVPSVLCTYGFCVICWSDSD